MKKLIVSLLMSVSLWVSAAPSAPGAVPVPQKEVPGGLVQLQGKGKFSVVNCQKDLPLAELKDGVQIAARLLFTTGDCVEGSGEWSFQTAAKLKEGTGANVVVFLVSDSKLPMSLVSLEGFWSVVNIAALKADGAAQDVVAKRAKKLFYRTLTAMIETSSSKYPASCLRKVENLADLDSVGDTLTIDHVMNICNAMPNLGFVRSRRLPYRAACIYQVAPPPTNDVQKTVWETVEKERAQGKFKKMKPHPELQELRVK